jgi:hypothetical protein
MIAALVLFVSVMGAMVATDGYMGERSAIVIPLGAWLNRRAQRKTQALLDKSARWLETRCEVPGCREPSLGFGFQWHGHPRPEIPALVRCTEDEPAASVEAMVWERINAERARLGLEPLCPHVDPQGRSYRDPLSRCTACRRPLPPAMPEPGPPARVRQ